LLFHSILWDRLIVATELWKGKIVLATTMILEPNSFYLGHNK
jgi:hypothetical protein